MRTVWGGDCAAVERSRGSRRRARRKGERWLTWSWDSWFWGERVKGGHIICEGVRL